MVRSTPRAHFIPGKDPVPILQEAGWVPGPVRTGGKSRPHRDSIPDRPAHSQSLYRLGYRAHYYKYTIYNILYNIYMYYVCISIKSAFVSTTKSTRYLHVDGLRNIAQNMGMYTYFLTMKCFQARRVQQRQHVDAVGCRTFFGGLSACQSFMFCRFLVDASRFVAAAVRLHSPCLVQA